MIYLILLGPPGVGKGTQAELLKDHYQLAHIATGDIFRKEINDQTELGQLAKNYIDKGQLVPNEVTMKMIKKHILIAKNAQNGFILDGIPRTIEQAKDLDILLQGMQISLTAVIAIEVDDEIVVSRISGRLTCPKCGATYHSSAKPPTQAGICDLCQATLITRSDDQPETVKERLKVYHQMTKPLIEYYKIAGKLISIDGTPAPTGVFNQILKALPRS